MFVVIDGSNQKGAVAEMKIATAATELGIPVLRPLSDHGRYDLAFEIGGRLLRVQCKYGALHRAPGVIKVNLQSSWCTPQGYVRNPYQAGEIDLLAIYCGGLDRCYLLPGEPLVGRRAIWLRLSPPLNGQRASINIAEDFEFAGAVAQLGERPDGIRQAGGSSPPSSIDPSAEPTARVVGAHEFRNHFGYYMERSAAGENLLVTRHGRPFVRLGPTSSAGIVQTRRLFDETPEGGQAVSSASGTCP